MHAVWSIADQANNNIRKEKKFQIQSLYVLSSYWNKKQQPTFELVILCHAFMLVFQYFLSKFNKQKVKYDAANVQCPVFETQFDKWITLYYIQ